MRSAELVRHINKSMTANISFQMFLKISFMPLLGYVYLNLYCAVGVNHCDLSLSIWV